MYALTCSNYIAGIVHSGNSVKFRLWIYVSCAVSHTWKTAKCWTIVCVIWFSYLSRVQIYTLDACFKVQALFTLCNGPHNKDMNMLHKLFCTQAMTSFLSGTWTSIARPAIMCAFIWNVLSPHRRCSNVSQKCKGLYCFFRFKLNVFQINRE